jgi:hypothetical protein
MEWQHVNVKLMLADSSLDLAPLIPIFHGWIRDRVCDELLLDIADYRHVPAGPGVVLIGYEADYSVDNAGGRLGVRYNRKAPLLEGTNAARLAQAARAAAAACQLLEADPSLEGKLRFGGREIEIAINDRLSARNDSATLQAAEPELRAFAAKVFPESDVAFSYGDDPRGLFRALLRTAHPASAADLLARLQS